MIESKHELRSQSTDQTASDEALVGLILEGDVAAFEELVRRHEPRLWRVILGIVGETHLAEDVLQEVLLIAYRKLETFRSEAKVGTWLMRIAVRHAGAARSRWRRLLQKFTVLHEERFVDRRDRLNRREEIPELDEILSWLNRVSSRERAALILHVVEDRSYAEIAEILGCPVGTVGSLVSRARTRLRLLLTTASKEREDQVARPLLAGVEFTTRLRIGEKGAARER